MMFLTWSIIIYGDFISDSLVAENDSLDVLLISVSIYVRQTEDTVNGLVKNLHYYGNN